jgi:hypothetical protein
MILELYCRDKEGKKILMKVIGGEFTFHFFAPLNKLCVSTNSGVEEYFCEELEYSVNGNFVYASIDAEKMFNDNNSAKDCQDDDKGGV